MGQDQIGQPGVSVKAAAVAVMAHEPAAEPGGVYERRQDSVFGRGGDVFGGGRRRAIAGVGPDVRCPAVAAVCGTAHRHRRRVARRAGNRVVDFAGPVGCVPVQDRVLSSCASPRASGSLTAMIGARQAVHKPVTTQV